VAYLTHSEFLAELNAGKLHPNYFFFGTESLLMDEALQRLKEVVLEPGSADFNYDLFRSGDDTINWQAFSDALTSLPLLSSRRLIVLKQAGKALRVKGVAGLLEKAVQNPSLDRLLLLVEEESELKGAQLKKIAEHCTVVHFAVPKPQELQKYLRDFAGRFGKDIAEDALSRILTDSNPSLRDLFFKLENLIFYIGEKKTIEVQDVEECTVFSREIEIFRLLQAIGIRDETDARSTLQKLLESRGDLSALVFLLFRQTWALYRMKFLQEKKTPPTQWQAQLNIQPPFLERRYREYLRHYSRVELGQALEYIAEADLARKASATGDDKIYWCLLEKLLHPTTTTVNRVRR
jgi:DNA polymerase-3 subunit delta